MKYWNLTMNCSHHMIPYLQYFQMDYIYKLLTVAILMSKNRWEEKTIDIVACSVLSTCGVDRTYNSILNMPWCHCFYHPNCHCSKNGLDIMKIFFICKEKCSFYHFC